MASIAFEFRARNRWSSGGENRSKIKDFYGAKAEDTCGSWFSLVDGGSPNLR